MSEPSLTPKGRPKDDGTCVLEFRTAEREALAISIPRSEAHVIRHFQERIPAKQEPSVPHSSGLHSRRCCAQREQVGRNTTSGPRGPF